MKILLAKIVVLTVGIIIAIFTIKTGSFQKSDINFVREAPVTTEEVAEKIPAEEANKEIGGNLPKTTATTSAETAPKQAVTKQPAVKPAPVVVPPPEPPKPLIPLEVLNETARAATVNIFCTTKTGGDFKPLSGSGIIINDWGVILTNAHVAQYLLLKDYGVKDFMSCAARAGSPASPAYKVELLYLPTIWLAENANIIKKETPEGTGENDYALLIITGSATQTPLPQKFPYVGINIEQADIKSDIPVLMVGYPANFLGGIATQNSLWIVSSPSFITKLYYFNDKNNIDAFSVGSNILAQKGVSGGAAVNQQSGKIEGVLTTISGGETTESRDLAAITTAHIGRSFKNNTGKDLLEYLNGDLSASLKEFTENTLPLLTKMLTSALDNPATN